MGLTLHNRHVERQRNIPRRSRYWLEGKAHTACGGRVSLTLDMAEGPLLLVEVRFDDEWLAGQYDEEM